MSAPSAQPSSAALLVLSVLPRYPMYARTGDIRVDCGFTHQVEVRRALDELLSIGFDIERWTPSSEGRVAAIGRMGWREAQRAAFAAWIEPEGWSTWPRFHRMTG